MGAEKRERPVDGAGGALTPAEKEDYVDIDGCRFVLPYHFDFMCGVKARWRGRELAEAMSHEFPAKSLEQYLESARRGTLRVEHIAVAKRGRAGGRVAAGAGEASGAASEASNEGGGAGAAEASEGASAGATGENKGGGGGGARQRRNGKVARAPPPAPGHEVLDTGMRVWHLVHRHEPPVPAIDPIVLGETTDLVAVHKPAGQSVHASGQHRKNSVLDRLRALHPGLGPLLPIHRLDRPVGGVLLFARSPAAADRFRRQVEAGALEKAYVARVDGTFPGGGRRLVVDAPLIWDPKAGHALLGCPAEDVRAQLGGDPRPPASPAADPADGPVDGPADSPADGPAASPYPAREAKSEFTLLWTSEDGSESLVKCRPLTGRTHQLRAHLAATGHPIANDVQYGGSKDGPRATRELSVALGVDWEGTRARRGMDEWQPLGPTARAGPEGPSHPNQPAAAAAAAAGGDASGDAGADPSGDPPSDAARRPVDAEVLAFNRRLFTDPRFLVPEELRDSTCPHCPYMCPRDYPLDGRPLWLHAVRYGGDGWRFESPLPDWAAVPERGVSAPGWNGLAADL